MCDDDMPEQLAVQLHAFANHLRSPVRHPLPASLDTHRVGIYRQLFAGNIASLLNNSFPVIRSIVPAPYWQQLLQDFYAEHRCSTPLFPQLAREFVEYLHHERAPDPDWPFLAELAHYEWVETALANSDRVVPVCSVCEMDDGALLQSGLVLSPLAWLLVYRFPVHRIGSDYMSVVEPELATYLLVYRNVDGEIHFIESDEATSLLVGFVSETASLAEAIGCFASLTGYVDMIMLQRHVLALVRLFLERGVLLIPQR